MDKETQNLYAKNEPWLVLGQSRVKQPCVVVSNWWYEEILRLLVLLKGMARGWHAVAVPKSKEYPFGFYFPSPNLELMRILIEADLFDDGLGHSQNYMPLGRIRKKLWRFKLWFWRMWRKLWFRERYKLDRYWMQRWVQEHNMRWDGKDWVR